MRSPDYRIDPSVLTTERIGVFISQPKIVGHYMLGNAGMGHLFGLTRKPSPVERFFVRHLLGLRWVTLPQGK